MDHRPLHLLLFKIVVDAIQETGNVRRCLNLRYTLNKLYGWKNKYIRGIEKLRQYRRYNYLASAGEEYNLYVTKHTGNATKFDKKK